VDKHETVDEYSERVRSEAITEMIESETFEPLKVAMFILNDKTMERVCLSRRQADIVLSHIIIRKRLLDQAYEYQDELSGRAGYLEKNVVPAIKKLLEEINDNEWVECDW